ncbi:MAG: hypothetical protein D6731_22420 [Planctomycetota bacterium]|nr:MAG: hypothetical protein D6731_22420 [Planctomycetota bacterium]
MLSPQGLPFVLGRRQNPVDWVSFGVRPWVLLGSLRVRIPARSRVHEALLAPPRDRLFVSRPRCRPSPLAPSAGRGPLGPRPPRARGHCAGGLRDPRTPPGHRRAGPRGPRPVIRCLRLEGHPLLGSCEVRFARGLNVITGGSGEGKSVLLEALRFGLGHGGGRSAARRLGAAPGGLRVELDVEAPWLASDPAFAELGLPRRWTLARELAPSGRCRAFVDGAPLRQGSLRSLGERLAVGFAQGASRDLCSAEGPRERLDAAAGLGEVVARYAERRAAWAALRAELADLDERWEALRLEAEAAADEASEREALAALDPQPGELDGLRARVADLEAREGELHELARLGDALAGGVERGAERGAPLEDTALEAAGRLARLGLEEAGEELRALAEGAARAARAVAAALEERSFDPAELEALRDRLDRYGRLGRRLGLPPERLCERWAELLARPDPAALAAERARVRCGLRAVEGELDALARELGDARRAAAARLVGALDAELPGLGLPGARACVEVEDLSGHPLPSGPHRVRLRVAPRAGAPAVPVAELSGGERSRVLLVLARLVGGRGALLFDEVDQNVGARLGAAVGRCLLEGAVGRQVVAVTHLAPVAARAQRHLRLARGEQGVRVEVVRGPERVAELALMIRGAPVTAAARAQARELLREARQEASRAGRAA